MFGVLNINKPQGCTSHDVVGQVRRKLQIKRVGHAGTLDPLATGVLPVCVGQATRLIEFFPSDKRYHAEIKLGLTTGTWDAEGEVLTSCNARDLTRQDIETLLKNFEGIIQQQVPPHSAVHVNGKKLYELTRKGIEVELPVRPAEIFSIQLVDYHTDNPEHPIAVVDIHCASGTYVRSIAQELGKLSGYGAYLSGLSRTAHGQFGLDTSITLDEFMESDRPQLWLQNPISFLPMTQVELEPALADKILHGMKLQPGECPERLKNNQQILLTFQGLPLAVAKGEASGRVKPVKVFPPELLQPV